LRGIQEEIMIQLTSLIPLDFHRHYGVINDKKQLVKPIKVTATDPATATREFSPIVADESIVEERRKRNARRRIYARVRYNQRKKLRRKTDIINNPSQRVISESANESLNHENLKDEAPHAMKDLSAPIHKVDIKV